MEELTMMSMSTENSSRGATENEIIKKSITSTIPALASLSNDVKGWLLMKPEHSGEREKICKDLEFLESQLIMTELKLNEAMEKGMPMEYITDLTLDITSIKQQREELLTKYWKQYFKSEWKNIQFRSEQFRATSTSPSTQIAAEKILLLNAATVNSTSWSPEDNHHNNNNNNNDSPAVDLKRGTRKRTEPPNSAIVPNMMTTTTTTTTTEKEDESQEEDPALIRCNCKKSRCLKLYCECFAARKMCVEECKCVDCANNTKHIKKRKEAIQLVLERRPDAFHTKVFVAASTSTTTTSTGTDMSQPNAAASSTAAVALAHARGCTCKKTKCTKKYCVCYNTGVKCGDWCRCQDCENGNADSLTILQDSDTVTQNNNSSSTTDKLSVLANITAAASPVQAL